MFKFKQFTWVALALLVAILPACSCNGQPPRSTIETLAVEVSRAPVGGGWASVHLGSPQSLNNGDRVSTSLQGEGMLKLPCAWLRIFRDTELRFQQISVDGANLAGAKGAALVETKCASFQVSNDSTPPEAAVQSHGTTFLVAFDRARRIVLLWTLDGAASLTNLRSDGAQDLTVSVAAGRWSVVRGRSAPEPVRPVSEMGSILEEMNLWDVYEKVIRLVPSASRVATPTPTATPSRFITPSPTPTQSPPPKVCGSGVLFCEDFESALASVWHLERGWQVTREGNDHVLSGEGHVWAILTGHEWGDYRVRFRLRILRGMIHLNYRFRETSGRLYRYFIGFDTGHLSLTRQEGSTFTELATVAAYHSPGSWHLVEIAGWGGHIVVYVNGQVELDYTDKSPLLQGGIAFETLDYAEAQIDDIEVMLSGSAPAPIATPTSTRTRTLTPTRTRTLTPTQTSVPVGTLSGRVTSGAKGIPNAQVTRLSCTGEVCFTPSARSVYTNSDGYYVYNEVPPGSYRVSVSPPGYAGQYKTATVYTNQTTTLNFALVRVPAASGSSVALGGSAACFDFDQGEKLSIGIDSPYQCPARADVQWTGTTLKPINGAGMGYPNPQANSYEACENSSPLPGGVNPAPGKYYCVFTQQDRTAVIRISPVTPSPYSVTFDWWRY